MDAEQYEYILRALTLIGCTLVVGFTAAVYVLLEVLGEIRKAGSKE